MGVENLDGMSSEQLMLRDLLYEIPELLSEADRNENEYRRGVNEALRLLERKLKAFGIDQTRFARPMPDIERWYFRGLK